MKTIEIIQESPSNKSTTYRAICGEKQALGRSPGQALDELEQQLAAPETNTLIIIQRFLPDHFFPEPQHQKLRQLMNKFHEGQDNQQDLSNEEQNELEALAEAELAAANERAKELLERIKYQPSQSQENI
jgi:protein subunit release factor A